MIEKNFGELIFRELLNIFALYSVEVDSVKVDDSSAEGMTVKIKGKSDVSCEIKVFSGNSFSGLEKVNFIKFVNNKIELTQSFTK